MSTIDDRSKQTMPESEAPKKVEGEVTPTPPPAIEERPVATAVPASTPAAVNPPVAKAEGDPPMTLDQLGAKFKTFRSRVVDAGLHRVADIIDGVLGAIEGKKG